MGDSEQRDQVQEKLDLLLDRFQDLSNRLAVQSVQLFVAMMFSGMAGTDTLTGVEIVNTL